MTDCVENRILKDTWSSFGESEPYWSVITNDQYKASVINNLSIQQFYESGKHNIDFIEDTLRKHNVFLTDKIVLDFGCGVGRLSKALASRCRHVYGIDISSSHIELANMHTKNTANTTFTLISCPEDIIPFKAVGVDVVVTLIVLQHNRPNIMKKYITELLGIVKVGGVAVLHIPYFIPNYWAEPTPGLMEMHYITKEEVNIIAQMCGCKILEVNEDQDMCGGGIKNALYIIQKVE